MNFSLSRFVNNTFVSSSIPHLGTLPCPTPVSKTSVFPSQCLEEKNYPLFSFLVCRCLLMAFCIWCECRGVQFSSVAQSCLTHCGMQRLQHVRLPCPSPTPGACSNSCPLSWWCHPTISSSVIPFFSCLQSFPASGSYPMSQFFTSGGQSIGASASASVLPMNIQDWFPLGLTSLISLQSKGLSRVFSYSHYGEPCRDSLKNWK